MSYAIYFDKENTTYRLPVNPEEIETSSAQAIEKYEILKLGQIAVPTHMELTEYSFEAEFPHQPLHYITTPGDFKDADFYLNIFRTWRDKKEPVRFIASNGIGDDTNTLVLIEELTIIEKAGEEGDKYISIQLLEYREFGKKTVIIPEEEMAYTVQTDPTQDQVNPKVNDTHVVVSGETLWAIAKKYYGDGSKSNIIYNANKDKIKNPNLIYPGQQLRIPEKSEFSKYSAPLPSTARKNSSSKSRSGKASSTSLSSYIPKFSPGRGGGLSDGDFSGGSSGGGGGSGGGGAF